MGPRSAQLDSSQLDEGAASDRVPRWAVRLVRALVLADCALAAAWLAGVSGLGTALRSVTLMSCVGIVVLAGRERPQRLGRRLDGPLARRLTFATAFVLAGVVVLTLIFR